MFAANRLGEYHLELIDDASSFRKGCQTTAQHIQSFRSHNGHKPKSIYSQLLLKLTQTYRNCEMFLLDAHSKQSKVPVIQPMGAFYFCWQSVQLAIIIHNFIQFPLLQTFSHDILPRYSSQLNLLFEIELILLLLDFFINCNIAVLDKGNLLLHRGQIAWKYINKPKGFLMDLIGFLGFLFQFLYLSFHFDAFLFILFQYLFLIKAFKLSSISKKIEKAANPSATVKGYLNLFKLFFFIFVVAHFLV